MTTTNPITGDKIMTRPSSKEYTENWERIFGKKEEQEESILSEEEAGK